MGVHEQTIRCSVISVRSACLVSPLLLLALAGAWPAEAAVVKAPAQIMLSGEAGENNVLLVKKKKNKARKRLGSRKKSGKLRAHRHARVDRHITPRTPEDETLIIVPLLPDLAFGLEPPPGFGRSEPHGSLALQAPPLAPDYAPVHPQPYEPQIATGPDAGLSCDDAIGVVQDFGFSDVEPRGCSGTIYEFWAVRDGEDYAISLRADDGELTRVERQ